MIEIIVSLIIGIVLGYIIRGEQKPVDNTLQPTIDKLNADVIYYKKLTKELAEENMEFRRKL
jgi:uncharacterized membrane-anchored protein YhcB (DUF1043 family)